jgi:hypothetical protein
LDYLKLKIVDFLFKYNLKIGQKLMYYQAKYTAEEEVEEMAKNQKFDLRGISNRAKNFLIHDQDILDKRWDECSNCEYLIKATNQCKKCGCFMKMGDNFVKIKVATASCPIGKWDKEYKFIEGKAVNGSQPIAEL